MSRFPVVIASALVVMLAWPGVAPAQKKAKVVNLPVNTEADEDEPHVGDNGLMLYWTVTTKGKEDIWFAKRRTAATAWPAKGSIIEDYVTSKGNDRGVYVTQTRGYPRYLYFAKKDEKGKNYDLFVAVQQDAGKAWTAPTPVMNANTEDDELHPWLSENGKTLFFSRKTKKGWRVYAATRDKAAGPGGWGEPRDVGLPEGYHHATLSPDGKTMYVQRRVDDGPWAVYVVKWQDKGWGVPAPLPMLHSSEAKVGDLSPNLSRDGKTLYFASDRPGGKGGLDLYSVSTADLAPPAVKKK